MQLASNKSSKSWEPSYTMLTPLTTPFYSA
eukprot:CCRYP_002813-RA/>CCRYP_002813-RA protein AED:0.49 eAED:1.00 QI:0/-1/0/1/-1/0/1/0/29